MRWITKCQSNILSATWWDILHQYWPDYLGWTCRGMCWIFSYQYSLHLPLPLADSFTWTQVHFIVFFFFLRNSTSPSLHITYRKHQILFCVHFYWLLITKFQGNLSCLAPGEKKYDYALDQRCEFAAQGTIL